MKRLKLAPLAAALALVAAPAFAQNPQQQEVFRQNCSGDYMRFCSAYNPGTPEVEQCFRQHMQQLSPQCRSAIMAFEKESGGGTRQRRR